MALGTNNVDASMKKLRSTFAEYGLGAETGIDLPTESTGFHSQKLHSQRIILRMLLVGLITTPLQLAQYASTVANNGKRVAPHLVESIYANNDQGGLGDLIERRKQKN